MKKDQDQCVTITADDLTSDLYNNLVRATAPKGRTVAVDMWKYSIYFFEKIQRKEISKDFVYIDGIRLDRYVDLMRKEKHAEKIIDFMRDKTSCELCLEMEAKHNTHVNWVALYGLCSYIREIINRRLALLLKPTLKDTISEIKDLENLDKISFELKDGSNHISDFCEVKKTVWEALNKCDDSSIGFHKIVKKVDVYTHEYGEIEFVRYISKFFHEYFTNVHRRKNSYLSVTEQKLVCFLLHYFGFAPAKVQESRYRQLFNSKYESMDHLLSCDIPGFFESNVKIFMEYIPYKVWSKGKINPLKENEIHMASFEPEFTLQMGEAPEMQELLDYLEGIF